MAGGPIMPSSVYYNDSSGRIYPLCYSPGTSTNDAPREWGHGVVGSLGGDSILSLRFPVPPGSVPTGTLKLRGLFLANATTGTINYTVEDGSCGAGVIPATVTLTSETQSSLSWGTGDADKYKEVKTTLTTSPAANDMLIVAVKFQTSGWTLAVQMCAIFSIIWE